MSISKSAQKAVDSYEKKLKRLTDKALDELEYILNDEMASTTSKIQAAKTLIDVAGLKKDTKEIADISYEVFINRKSVKCK